MLFGHMGLGLAAKRIAPGVSTGLLLTAAVAPDVLFGIFFFLGLETAGGVVPWSHGLFMSGIWSVSGGAITFIVTRRLRAGLVIGGLVLSHWVLDFIAHPPVDLPLFWYGSPLAGLGLGHSIPAEIIVEFCLLAGGTAVFLATTRAVDRLGTWAFWIMFASFFALLFAAVVIPPELAGLSTLPQLGLLPLGLWVDRHRGIRSPAGRNLIRANEHRRRV